jgi:hypothetical protein
MSKLRKAIFWLWDYWYIPIFVIVALIGYFTFSKWRGGKEGYSWLTPLLEQFKIIKEGSNTREMMIQLGTEQAVQHIKDKYQAKYAELDAEQALKVQTLEQDPVALVKFLEKISR